MKKTVRKPDRRVQKTQAALYEALMSLVKSNGYDAVTVQDILERANVGRSTFYAHYPDKDSLLVSGIQRLEAELSELHPVGAGARGSSAESVVAFSLAMMEHAAGFREVYRGLMGGPGGSIARRHIQDMVGKLMKTRLDAVHARLPARTRRVPVPLLVQSLSGVFMSTMEWWFDQRASTPPEEVNGHFRALVLPVLGVG